MGRLNTNFEELVLNSVDCYKTAACLASSVPQPYCGSPVDSLLEVEHVGPLNLGLSTHKTEQNKPPSLRNSQDHAFVGPAINGLMQ